MQRRSEKGTNLTFFNLLEGKMCTNCASQWCVDKGNNSTTKTVFVRRRYGYIESYYSFSTVKKINMMQQNGTKLVDCRAVNFSRFANDREEMVGV